MITSLQPNGLVWYIFKKLKRSKDVSSLSVISTGDSSSMADVAFLLLIFFIVTSSFLLPQGFFLKLPSDLSKPIVVKKKYIIDVYPENNGAYLINKMVYDADKFKDFLVNKLKETPETIMVVHVKKDIFYYRFTDTLQIARESRLTRISLKEIE